MENCSPLTVEGDWSPAQTKTVKNKLQLHFLSRKKSNGGDCRVEVEDGAPRAAVHFTSEEVRARVLQKENHEIVVDGQTVKLRLISEPSSTNNISDSKESQTKSDIKPENGASAAKNDDSQFVQSTTVLLENVPEDMSGDLLSMLVENISGLDSSSYSLEMILESNSVVVTFNSPADVERFLTVSQTNKNIQKYGLTARALEAPKSVRVESLPPTAVKDLLELYFEKSWSLPDNIIMIPDEQAAIVTFSDPKVVENICIKDHMLSSTAIKVYPYCESLGTALYGNERPTWKMPKSFTEKVHPAVWKFILMKKSLKSINDKMSSHFCRVELSVDNPEMKVNPLPSFLRQKNLTAEHVDNWRSSAQEVFHQQMSQYSTFECNANEYALKAAETDVRSVVKEDAFLALDASRGALTVAGRADDIKRIRAPVENIVLKAINQIERQTNGISELVDLSPALFYILKQEGLKKAASDISPEMNISYSEDTQKLTITGLPGEVFQLKSWILERNMHMSKKQLNLSSSLLDFLKTVDPMDMSQDLFSSQGISAFYSIETKGVFLIGSYDRVLADAESKLKTVLSSQTLDVEDQNVLKLPSWADLKQQLLDTYNSSKKRTVIVQIYPETRDKVSVAGFVNPVNEVSRGLKEFIVNYSHFQETLRVESCAVVQFIDKKKLKDYTSIAKTYDVTVHLDSQRPRISISGARLHVQKAKSCFQELISTFCTDAFTVDKPGAKKYFMSQGSLFLTSVMTELNCVVVLRPENQEEEEEEENCEEENGLCYCKVKTTSGVLVSVSKADICRFRVDAVVNAANEDLQHIGGLALALLKAAGPQLQKVSDDYVAKNGRLRPGDAITTDAFDLPCKCIVHAVGPQFSDSDRTTAVSRLKLAVKESLKQAEMKNCSTIALPAISSGEFGFPVDLCAGTIAEAVREYCDGPQGTGSLTEIHLVDNNDNTIRVMATAVKEEFNDLSPTMTEPPQKGLKGARDSSGHKLGQRKTPKGWGRGAQGGKEEGKEGRGRAEEERRAGFEGNLQSIRGHTVAEEARGSGRMEQTTTEGLKILLCKGNIQHQTTDVIVNTIGDDMNLDQGAVSKALLEAAGPRLQTAVHSEAKATRLQFGDVVITKGFELWCQNVFHTVCPKWDNGAGQAEEALIKIIKCCLEEAEKLKMKSLSFPAIGTRNLSFPRDLVCRVLLKEIHSYSRSRTPRHLREVAIVVHPSDGQTVDCFTNEFKGQTGQKNIHYEEQDSNESPVQPRKTQQTSAFFGPVTSPSLGVYQMQMGQLILHVSSGDITKETSDAIVNSSNTDFSLKAGVSKAILDSAGPAVLQECREIVSAPGYQQRPMIVTTAGQLPSKNIVHIGGHDPAKIKEVVYSVLNICEENKFNSVSFPALGTGRGGVDPSEVAGAMVGAVVDFVRKKHPKFVHSVKILIFQTSMMTEFHKSMKSREGQGVEQKTLLTKIKDSITSFLGLGEERSNIDVLVLEKEEFEPAVFQLCADNDEALSQAKKRIDELIVAEQVTRIIKDPYISELSMVDMEQLKSLQRELTVSIHLDKGLEGQEPKIHLEGLTRDVFTAESSIRDIIQKVMMSENLKNKALYVKGLVEWQYLRSKGEMVPFDLYTNLQLEEALEKKRDVNIKINNKTYIANVMLKKAVRENGHKELELYRKELKEDPALPENWDDMKSDLLKLFPLTPGSEEYKAVETEMTKTSLSPNIISIERVQNLTLWKSYQLMKKELEKKNQHTNNEKLLFHGTTSKAIDFINKQGFNRSYAGTEVGAKFGKGSYFAVDPVYSANGFAAADVQGHKRMYQARVLVGDFIQGKPEMITPPSKNTGNAADLYDSVTDDPANPNMFVVFNDIQAYPEYLITFT
ncbi:Poly [ADP-ribose] polymerase 14 [Channa argus]|uniref:Poly [ADP-ribose] polymerase n=1 Tax=Channa argus TaxID=215402 RepID=A0A6G1PYL2_CHAAH|nr:Poly [ADP-ribose] polymerase 14 [Channa argus]